MKKNVFLVFSQTFSKDKPSCFILFKLAIIHNILAIHYSHVNCISVNIDRYTWQYNHWLYTTAMYIWQYSQELDDP